jgi:hypothetical protein
MKRFLVILALLGCNLPLNAEQRTIRGSVYGDGVSLVGDGFSSVRQRLGTYRITFSPPFQGVPVVIPVQGRSYIHASVGQAFLSNEGVTIYTTNAVSGSLVDLGCSFIAIGP